VVARTWAAAMRGRHAREAFDFCSTTHCQNYKPAGIKPGETADFRDNRGGGKLGYPAQRL
jgi:hypothetical protein